MKPAKRNFLQFLAMVLAFAALLSLSPATLASEGADLAALLGEYIQSKSINGGDISIAYYNTANGEEYLWNSEEYFTAASIYKLPLNMYYYELEAAGEISPDTRIGGHPLSSCHQHSLQYSNNELSEAMVSRLGTYQQYKTLIAKYGGIPLESLPNTYFTGNRFNTAFILNTLKILYDGQEFFADAIRYLKDATPGQWFETNIPDSECTIAQKYGWVVSDRTYAHTAGIVYTEEPFLLVVFTRGVANGGGIIGDIARICYDYNLANINPLREKVLNYRDVFNTDWYGEAVAYCTQRGVISGTSDTAFSPKAELTRGMFVTMLGRLSGVEKRGGSFADVNYGDYYSDYVEWAYQNGIVQGMDGANFEPNTPITCEQAAVIFHRYMTARGLDPSAGGRPAEPFRDAGEISDYAKSAADALHACGIFVGDDGGCFNPKQYFSRAQAAVLFMRMDQYLKEQPVPGEGEEAAELPEDVQFV